MGSRDAMAAVDCRSVCDKRPAARGPVFAHTMASCSCVGLPSVEVGSAEERDRAIPWTLAIMESTYSQVTHDVAGHYCQLWLGSFGGGGCVVYVRTTVLEDQRLIMMHIS